MLLIFKKTQNLKYLTVNIAQGLLKQCSHVQIFCFFVERNLMDSSYTLWNKGPVKLIKPVKIAHSFSQSVSDQFHVIILSLSMNWLSKNVSKPNSKNGDMGHFNL